MAVRRWLEESTKVDFEHVGALRQTVDPQFVDTVPVLGCSVGASNTVRTGRVESCYSRVAEMQNMVLI